MTTLSTPGIQRPPPRTIGSGGGRPPTRTVSQVIQQTPRSIPQQVFIDQSVGARSVRNLSSPVAKRRKLDTDQGVGDQFSAGDVQERSLGAFGQQAVPTIAQPVKPKAHAEPSFAVSEDNEAAKTPFPLRLGSIQYRKHNVIGRNPKAVRKEEVQNKPYNLEIPKIAPQYWNQAPTDFFPWKGNHPEDILNEQSTKSGYYDRTQVSQNESNTARPSVWSSLKHRSGLQIISSLFVSALDQRQLHGTVTARCTFKPPPRVTLTEFKRDAWLNDLANPTIPLRRLSRSIPHGIRGKQLLDHCVTKNIPTWRAVWLAKCVGANEIRAFKRKGTTGAFAPSGEAKWIKDWTASVAQFVDGLLESCGAPDWQTRMSYGLQLVHHLYSEHLLDHEQFLDWIVSSFHGCDVDRIPVWLLMVQMHWKEIWQYRHRGRRIAASMLHHLQTVSQLDRIEVYSPIGRQLRVLLRSCVVSFPDCFVLPNCWTDLSTILASCSDEQDKIFTASLKRLRRRNGRLVQSRQGNEANQYSPRQKLIGVLDKITRDFSIKTLSEHCLKAVQDRDLLITTIFEWSTTVYRSSADRLYIGVRLLRRWSTLGIQLDQPILTFLESFSCIAGSRKTAVHKVVAELVQSRHFSVSKYLQWVMARGLTGSNSEYSKDKHSNSELLLEIPLCGLPTHVLSLRQILLNRDGYSVADEQNILHAVKSDLAGRMPELLSVTDASIPCSVRLELMKNLKGTVKAEISRWIRQSIFFRFSNIKRPPDSEGKPACSLLTLSEFKIVRCTLETYEEHPVLADILGLASNSNETLLLGAIADTLNFHFDIFRAIGAIDDLFHRLLSNTAGCLSRVPSDAPLLMLLIDLGERLPNAHGTVRQLRKEISLCESKPALAACSPVSDHVAEVLRSTESTFVEETEILLGSGNSVDRQTLSRLFATVTRRLEKACTAHDQSTVGLCNLLAHLRAFDPETFDALLLDWLESAVFLTNRLSVLSIVPLLVCTEAMTLLTFVNRLALHLTDLEDLRTRSRLALDVLSLLVVQPLGASQSTDPMQRSYRFLDARRRVVMESPSSVVLLIRSALDSSAHQEQSSQCRACALIMDTDFILMVQIIVVNHETTSTELKEQLHDQTIHNPMSRLLDYMLEPERLRTTVEPGNDIDLRRLLNIVNDFNVDVCYLKLVTLLNRPQASLGDTERSSDKIIATLVQGAISTSKSQPALLRLISKLPHKQATRFHEQAISMILTTFPQLETAKQYTANELEQQRSIREGLISSLTTIDHGMPDNEPISIVVNLQEKLDKIKAVPLLGMAGEEGSHDCHFLKSHEDGEELDTLCTWIDVLLRLMNMHQNMLRHPTLSSTTLPHLVLDLSLLLISPALTSQATLSVHIFDTVALLSDHLSFEARSLCIRTLRDQYQLRDPRLQFLIGYCDSSADSWLHLVTSISATRSGPSRSRSKSETATTTSAPFPLRRWEMIEDASLIVGENDTALSLSLFGARKAIL